MTDLLAGRKVLVVDDEPLLREILREELQAAGATTVEAENGEQAYALFRSPGDFDAVVSDAYMAKGSGIDLLEKIKNENASSPAVILFSANWSQPTAALFARGAEAVLTKPFDQEELPARVARSLLSFEERLSRKTSGPIDVELRFEEVAWIGRGGLFIPYAVGGSFPQGTKLRFSVPATLGGEIRRIEGEGEVLWARPQTRSGLEAGLGLELTFLEPDYRAFLIRALEIAQPIAYIPQATGGAFLKSAI